MAKPTEEERDAMRATFRKFVESAVLKDGPHVQKEVMAGIGKGLPRYYTVTTFSSGPTFGGTGPRSSALHSSWQKGLSKRT